MLKFSPEELTDQEKKKFLIGSIIPRPIALVSTMSNMSIVNIAPFSYFNIASYDPPILAVSVQRVEGQLKETKVRYETELYDSMVIYNDKNQPAADMILLKVKYYHIDEAIYEGGYIDPVKLNAVSRLAGNDYAEIGKMFTIKRPEN